MIGRSLILGVAAFLGWPLVASPKCDCGQLISAERSYTPPPAEIDLPFYTVHFQKSPRRSVELVAELYRFSSQGEMRTTWVSVDGSNWKSYHSGATTNDDLVPIVATPQWDSKDRSFGLKFSEGSLSVTRDHGESWAVVPDNDALQHPVVLTGQEQALAALKARGLHAHHTVASWEGLIIFAITFDPRARGIVYFVSNQGIFKSCDYGNSWSLLTVGTQMLFAVHSLAINPSDTAQLMVGTTDGVYISRDNGCTFKQVLGMQK